MGDATAQQVVAQSSEDEPLAAEAVPLLRDRRMIDSRHRFRLLSFYLSETRHFGARNSDTQLDSEKRGEKLQGI